MDGSPPHASRKRHDLNTRHPSEHHAQPTMMASEHAPPIRRHRATGTQGPATLRNWLARFIASDPPDWASLQADGRTASCRTGWSIRRGRLGRLSGGFVSVPDDAALARFRVADPEDVRPRLRRRFQRERVYRSRGKPGPLGSHRERKYGSGPGCRASSPSRPSRRGGRCPATAT
jgi:hypothetical protein